jgi:DNA-directed RNA polymerase subunit RPC12/RpoP
MVSHPFDNRSSYERWLCVDERGCVRRSRMKMKPGYGTVWGYESTSHVLIECKTCSVKGMTHGIKMATGIREEWIWGDRDFPKHQYVCSSCGELYLETEWAELRK